MLILDSSLTYKSKNGKAVLSVLCFNIDLFFSSKAQEVQSYDHTAIIDQHAKSLNRALEVMRKDIGNAKIVLLGEQTHYDGATFTTRFELIKFLHEKMGFNLLVFESGFYDMDKANRLRKQGTAIQEIFSYKVFSKGSLMGVWLETAEFGLLVNYLKEHPDLEIGGFDCQVSGSYALENLIPELVSFLNKNGIKISADETGLIEEALYELGGGDFKNFLSDETDFNSFMTLCDQLESKILNVHSEKPLSKETDFWLQWVRNFKGTIAYFRNEGQGEKFIVQNPRDSLMANNLRFIIDHHPDKKIIGMGASYHFARNLNLIDYQNKVTNQYIVKRKDWDGTTSLSKMLEGAVPMGHYLKEIYGDELYTIAFTTYEGQWGYQTDSSFIFNVAAPPVNSIEHLLKEFHNYFNFLPSKEIASEMLFSSVFGYLPVKAQWGQIFDGYAYVEKTHPVVPVRDTVLSLSNEPYRIQGKVLDKATGEPLAYANVFIKNTALGTVSNYNGNFSLSIPPEHKNDSVYISFVGYKPFSMVLGGKEDLPKVVSLAPSEVLLDQVEVNANLTVEQIISRVRENLIYNYIQEPYSSEVFFREKRSINDSVFYLEEAALNFYDAEGFQRESNRNVNNKFFQVIQLRRSLSRKRNKNFGIYDIQQFLIFDPVLSEHNITGKRRLKHYKTNLLGRKQLGDQTVFEIAFECTKPTVFTTGYGYPSPSSYRGKLYVDTESFAIVKYEATIERDQKYVKKERFLKQFDIKRPSLFKWRQNIVFTYKKIDNHYFLHYAKAIDYYDFLVGKKKEPVHQVYQSEILSNKIEIQKPVQLKESKLVVNPQDIPYDKEFWDEFIFVEDEDSL